ncbi:C-terminal binding protein [Paraburkholderia panacisoli]|uniref:C-terminal binding protein n=1 Tax=Paraburkholderia panacisoli TaxID=2603818 RepID=A0A5B0G386_9BURK|nr:C-terminal binding protein [Paraburkholderia panacisoli]KAA0997866.1 C-terminal binding protein [Paraburkholderia panacisoli]
MSATVLLTDYAWPDDAIERRVIESAGFQLITGPASPASESEIDALVEQHQPDAIMTCWAKVSSAAIRASAGIKVVARLGVGLDNIAVQTATERGIWVTNVPDYCVAEVSDHAVGFALAWTRGLISFDREVRSGRWNPAGANLKRLADMTCGIIGYGRIGHATASKLNAFGCRVLSHTLYPPADIPNVQFVGLEDLMSESDIVIVHAPLTDSTFHLINRSSLALMKPGGLLINVSRGGIVDTDAVVEALQTGQLSGAALDVLEMEPNVPEALLSTGGAMLTPHVAFSSDASLAELRRRAAEEVVRVLAGGLPEHPCNQPQRA